MKYASESNINWTGVFLLRVISSIDDPDLIPLTLKTGKYIWQPDY